MVLAVVLFLPKLWDPQNMLKFFLLVAKFMWFLGG